MQIPKQWYRVRAIPRWDSSLPGEIERSLCHCGMVRKEELNRMAVLAFAYERDWWHRSAATHISGHGHHFARLTSVLGDDTVPGINQLMAAIDTVTNKVVEQPSITCTTSNASFEELRQWDTRQRALNHQMSTPEADDAMRLWARDGLVRRIGWLGPRFDAPAGRISLRRWQPWQVHFDPHDALLTGEPTFIHIVELVDRDHFLAFYRKAKALNSEGEAIDIPDHDQRFHEIENKVTRAHDHIAGLSAPWQGAYQLLINGTGGVDTTDRIRVVHSYRISSRAGEPDGRYACTVLGARPDEHVLAIDMPFARDSLPVVSYVPTPTGYGLRGIALADSLYAVQLTIDRTIAKLSLVQDAYGHHKVFVAKGTNKKVIAAALAAGIALVEVDDPAEMPKLVPPQVLSQEQLSWLRFVLDVPSNELGITQVVTQGISQLGANASGRARVEEVARARDRQEHLIKAFGRARLRLAREILNAIEDAVRIDPKFAAQFRDRRGLWTETPWAELTQPHADWIMRLEEVGRFGEQRAARVSKILDDAVKGLVSPQQAFAAIVGPADEEHLDSRAVAMQRKIERDLWILSDPKGDHATAQPTEDTDLALAIQLTQQTINLAQALDAKPETITRLRSYLFAAQQLVPPPQPEAAAIGEVPVSPV